MENVIKYLESTFPSIMNLNIKELEGNYHCTGSYYVSDVSGNPTIRNIHVKVGLVEGFLKIVE